MKRDPFKDLIKKRIATARVRLRKYEIMRHLPASQLEIPRAHVVKAIWFEESKIMALEEIVIALLAMRKRAEKRREKACEEIDNFIHSISREKFEINLQNALNKKPARK